MANMLDELNPEIREEGLDTNVIAKKIPTKVGFGSTIFEILLWVLGIIPGVIFLFKKIKAKNYFMQLEQKIQRNASQIDNYLEQRVIVLQNCARLLDKAIDLDWTGTIATGSVALSEINANAAAAGTQAKLEEVKAKLVAGEIHVFDTDTFTVGGEKLTSYMADVDTDAAYAKDTEVIKDGYFHESEFRAAPYFDIQIDGITLLNTNFG